MSLSMGDYLKVKRLRAAGFSWNEIAAQIKCSNSRMRMALDPDYAERYRARRRAKRRAIGLETNYRKVVPPRINKMEVPADVLSERERVSQEMHSEMRSFTAELFGDPAPSRSALGKRHE